MPLAQNPSIAPFSSACAAVSPKLTELPVAPGTGPMRMPSRRGSRPAAASSAAQPHLDPGRGADAPALQCREIAARDAELGPHDEKPVHALRQRAEQFDAAPFGERPPARRAPRRRRNRPRRRAMPRRRGRPGRSARPRRRAPRARKTRARPPPPPENTSSRSGPVSRASLFRTDEPRSSLRRSLKVTKQHFGSPLRAIASFVHPAVTASRRRPLAVGVAESRIGLHVEGMPRQARHLDPQAVDRGVGGEEQRLHVGAAEAQIGRHLRRLDDAELARRSGANTQVPPGPVQ